MKKMLLVLLVIVFIGGYLIGNDEPKSTPSIKELAQKQELSVKDISAKRASTTKSDQKKTKIDPQIKNIVTSVDIKFNPDISFETSEYYNLFLEAFSSGNFLKAISFGENLLRIPDRYSSEFWYGDLCHAVYILLGKSYLAQGEIIKAQEQLIKSVDNKCIEKSEGRAYSPILSSFGPDRTLAFSLYKINKKKTVIEFFELTRKFWESGVEEGIIDNAIANLLVTEKSYEQEDDPNFPFEAVGHTVSYTKAPMNKSER